MVDEFVRGDIELLRPAREVTETPAGRMRAIDLDKSQLYLELMELLEAGPVGVGKDVFEGQVNEILDVLIDLDRRQLEAFTDAVAERVLGGCDR